MYILRPSYRCSANPITSTSLPSALTYGMKRCTRCKTTKPLNEFWRDKTRDDGRETKCIQCQKTRPKTREELNSLRERKYRWMARNKHKVRAHAVIANLVKKGTLKAVNCIVCNAEPPTEAHHIDYAFPEKIIWLCTYHHSMIHHG